MEPFFKIFTMIDMKLIEKCARATACDFLSDALRNPSVGSSVANKD